MKRYAVLAALAIAAYQLIPAGGWWTSGWQLAIGCLGGIPQAGAEFENIQWASRSIDMVFLLAYVLFGLGALHTDAGDRLLEEASAAWHGALRAVDLLARYGGEEFIVLLPDAGEAEARQIVERAPAVTPQGQTFSAGIAVWDGGETPEQLVARAGAALHVAEVAGRNRVMA